MKQNIQKLIKESNGFWEHGDYGFPSTVCFSEENIVKFVDNIVKECVEQLELIRKYRYDRVQLLDTQQTIIDECQYHIRQHFGIEYDRN